MNVNAANSFRNMLRPKVCRDIPRQVLHTHRTLPIILVHGFMDRCGTEIECALVHGIRNVRGLKAVERGRHSKIGVVA